MKIKELQRLLKEDEQKSLINQSTSTEYQSQIANFEYFFRGRNEDDEVTSDDLMCTSFLLFLDDKSSLLKNVQNEYSELNTILQVCRRLNLNTTHPMEFDTFERINAKQNSPNNINTFLFHLFLNPKFDVTLFNSKHYNEIYNLIEMIEVTGKQDLGQLEQLEELFISLNEQQQLNDKLLSAITSCFRNHFNVCRGQKLNQDEKLKRTKQVVANLVDLVEWVSKTRSNKFYTNGKYLDVLLSRADNLLVKIKEQFEANSSLEPIHHFQLRVIFNRFIEGTIVQDEYGLGRQIEAEECLIAIYKSLLVITPNIVNDKTFVGDLVDFLTRLNRDGAKKGDATWIDVYTTDSRKRDEIKKIMPDFVSSLIKANVFPTEGAWKNFLHVRGNVFLHSTHR